MGLCSDIRRGVGGVRHVGHLEHHDPLHGAGLGGLQGDPGPAGQAGARCGEEHRHHPVAPGHSRGSPATGGLQQVSVLHSHWSNYNNPLLSLVESFYVFS